MMATINFLSFTVFWRKNLKLYKIFTFADGEAVSGEILIQLKKQGQKLEHQGIRLELIGQIGLYFFLIFGIKKVLSHSSFIVVELQYASGYERDKKE